MEQIIFHIDVNNAFLSWTAVDLLKKGYPIDIRTIPAVIGGDEQARKGIVLAKSMPAKKQGIKTGDTLYSARSTIKNLQIFPPDYKLYKEMSNKLFTLLEKYIPYIEKASIDEGYFNYTEIKNIYKDEVAFAYKLKDEIKNTLGFTVNIGIANSKLCAKMASDFTKPDKVHTLYKHEIEQKMWPLPIEELFTVGKQTSAKLRSLGINTIKDLALSPLPLLTKNFKNQGLYYKQIANGIDDSKVLTAPPPLKGLSHEFTFRKDLTTKEEAYEQLELLSDMTSRRLRKENKYTKTICIIIKGTDFKRITHQKKLKENTNVTKEIYKMAKIVFDEIWDERPIRLLGLRLDDLSIKTSKQLSLFESNEEIKDQEQEEQIDKLIDEINKKYKHKVLTKASLINKDINR